MNSEETNLSGIAGQDEPAGTLKIQEQSPGTTGETEKITEHIPKAVSVGADAKCGTAKAEAALSGSAEEKSSIAEKSAENGKKKAKKSSGKSKKPLIFLAVFFLAVLIFAVAELVHMFIGYASARQQYAEINETYVNMVPEIVFAAPDSSSPVYSELSPVSVDFDGLKAACADIQGWLYSDGTIISYPVVQADDNDTYLHNAMDGSYSYGGTLFVDCICEPDFQGKNTIIYGHNMNDGSMFASLLSYRDQAYYEEHPVMYLSTPEQNYKVKIFAGYTTPADSDTYTYSFADGAAFEEYAEKMAEQSDFDSGILPGTDDRIITLSTCCYDYDEARYVIQGILVPIG